MPRPAAPVTAIACRDGAEVGSAVVQPRQDSHISFHSSGAVNVHGIASEGSVRLRNAQALDDTAPLFTCGFRNFDNYEPELKANEQGVCINGSGGMTDWPHFVSVFALPTHTRLDDKPYVVLSAMPLEALITVGPTRTRYLFTMWTSPLETFRNACGGTPADFVVLPGLPAGVSIRKPD